MQTRVCIHTCAYASVYVCIYIHVSVWMSTCVRVCIYRCIHVHIYTHRHTCTYPDGNTHPCVCVCLCLSVCHVCAHTRIYGESTSILQKGLFCPTPIKASDTSTSKRETTPYEQSGQEVRTDPFLPKKGRKDRHPEAQGRTHIHAELGWTGAAGGRGGLMEAPHPGVFPWTMILLIWRGKAQEPGIAIMTASSNHQRTVAPDGSNASFLQLRKLWAGSERSDLIPWRLTDRETTSLGKRVLRCTLPQRFPHSTQPSNSTGCPRREGTKKIRTCVCVGLTPIPR